MHGVQTKSTTQHRSVSQLTSYAGCSLRYRLERIDKAPQAQAAWTIQGLAVHAAVEHYERSRRTASLEDCINAYVERWDDEMAVALRKQPDINGWLRGGRKQAKADIEERYELGQRQVAEYIEDVSVSPWIVAEMPDGSPAVEVPFSIDLDGIRVIGYIDQIIEHAETGVLRVRDLKTGNEPAWPIQLVMYRMAMMESLGFDIQGGDFYLCKKRGPSKTYDLTGLSRGTVAKWYAALDKGIREGVYLPNPGNCFPCSVKAHCPTSVMYATLN